MTNKEIKTLLNIPTSTMSDWDKSEKRSKLARLLKNISVEDVNQLLNIKDLEPKYSQKTQKIRLNKKLFTKDILWAQEDGSEVSIKNLISAFFNIPNQEDTATLIQLFGEVRVRNILKKNKFILSVSDYEEINEQIIYAVSPDKYNSEYSIPELLEVLENPKQRHVERLMLVYSQEEILDIAKSKHISLSNLLQIKKFLTKQE